MGHFPDGVNNVRRESRMVHSKDGWLVLLTLWIGCAVFALITTARWLVRNGSQNHTLSVLSSAAAAVPGFALLLQLGIQLARERFFGAPKIWPYDLLMTPISCLWWVVGPILLIYGFVRRSDDKRPPGTVLVQLGHAALWAISSFVSLEIAIRV
jgi:hypothetical protein